MERLPRAKAGTPGRQLRSLRVGNRDLETDVPPATYYLHFLNNSADGQIAATQAAALNPLNRSRMFGLK